MMLKVEPGSVEGSIVAPPSKSYTHRAMMMGFLTRREFIVENPLICEDTLATLDGIQALGCRVWQQGKACVLHGVSFTPPSGEIDARNSGTTLRLLTGISSLLDCRTVLTGDESLRKRPMRPLLDALRMLGAQCAGRGHEELPPVSVKGPIKGTKTRIRGDVSSQFISSLLMSCPLKAEATEITITTPLKSEPYLEVTLHMLKEFRVEIERTKRGFHVDGGQNYSRSSYQIPGDFSSASFIMAAAAITNGTVSIKNLDMERVQGDSRIVELLRGFGAEVSVEGDSISVSSAELSGQEVDVSQTPDLFPVLAVLGAYCHGTTLLYNGEHLRFKESDRIEATARFLKDMGADITELADGCRIQGGRPLRGATTDSRGDHRILMAAAVAALGAKGPCFISHPNCYQVSYPSFLQDMTSLGVKTELVS